MALTVTKLWRFPFSFNVSFLPLHVAYVLEVSDRGGNSESIVLHAMKLKALEKMQCKTI